MANPTAPPQAPTTTEQYTIISLGSQHKKNNPNPPSSAFNSASPLTDTTAPLVLHSKKTKRLEKKQHQLKNQHGLSNKPNITNLLNLPPELIHEILIWLRPSDLLIFSCVSKAVRDFVYQDEHALARCIIAKRYRVLSRCFPLPVPASRLGAYVQSILLNAKRQGMLLIHKKPYQHIRPPDALTVCSCTWCLLCWNNLCLVLDFAHFQENLNEQQPIPTIARGESPLWNVFLTEHNASIVEKAMYRPLVYAAILERHLASIVGTLTRKHVGYRQVRSGSGKWVSTKEKFLWSVYKMRPYRVTDAEADAGEDFWLERGGKPCYEFPYHRDGYYSLEAYVPNRKWDKEEERWLYYDGLQHERDVAVAVRVFGGLSGDDEAGAGMAGVDGIVRKESGISSGSNSNGVDR